MRDNFDASFKMVLSHEGGYVNDPRDPGGATNMGVTQRAWEDYVGHPVSERSMIALTRDMVKPFYRAKYWDKIGGDSLPSGVDHAAFDLAVNSGVSRAARYMQRIAGVPEDGIIGPKSLEAISVCPPDKMIDALCSTRLDFLKRLPRWKTYGRGWSRRVAEVELQATKMANTA
jgi:lysozyme family protein